MQQQVKPAAAWKQRWSYWWRDITKEIALVPPYIWGIAIGLSMVSGYLLPVTFKYAAAAVVASLVVTLSAIAPKRALYGVWVLMVLEGGIRKWVFPGAQEFIYFGKDVVVAGIYLGVLPQRYTEHRNQNRSCSALYT